MVENSYLQEWIDSVARRTRSDNVVWINGSEAEAHALSDLLVSKGVFLPLNQDKYPNCFLSRSDPSDVARVEERTFICPEQKENAGPTNNWKDPQEMYSILNEILEGCMAGRTMYVLPYLMGSDASAYSRVGIEITDSPYVVANMRIMARVGDVALKNLGKDSKNFVKGIHSTCELNPAKRYIAHFPEDNLIVSVNSNYGGNALLGKKCFALRMASILGHKEGWLAEHMLIVAVENPEGEKHYIAAAFPSGCGKTNLAMLIPPESYRSQGWKVSTIGDDIAWLHVGDDGRLYATNPEAGFFGIAPGTSLKTNPNALQTICKNTIFTNVALNTDDNTPWWEGLTDSPPPHLKDWLGKDWKLESGTKAAHPNSRFTAPAHQCPCIDPLWESKNGVPLSAIVFGGRRAKIAPLVVEARDWIHGVFLGATMASETTSAAEGKTGVLRRDPMAMSPFIGYHVGDYFQHWLRFAEIPNVKLPKIFHVNWFRTNADGKFLWPGFGENLRVLEWILRRTEGNVKVVESFFGNLPFPEDINTTGLPFGKERIVELLTVEKGEWKEEVASQRTYFDKIGDKFPKELFQEWERLNGAVEGS